MKCSCANDGHCHPATGHCSCAPGWTGLSCQRGRRPLPGIPPRERPPQAQQPPSPVVPAGSAGPGGDGILLQPVTAGTGALTAATPATAVPAAGAATLSAACVCARPATGARDASNVSPARPEAVCVHVHPHAHRHVPHMYIHLHTCTPHMYMPHTMYSYPHAHPMHTNTHACHTHVYAPTHMFPRAQTHMYTPHIMYTYPHVHKHAPACTDTCTHVHACTPCNRCTRASVGESGPALLSPEEQGFCSPELTSSPPSPSPRLPPPGPSSRLTWGSGELRRLPAQGRLEGGVWLLRTTSLAFRRLPLGLRWWL